MAFWEMMFYTEIVSTVVAVKDKGIFYAAFFALKPFHYTFPKVLSLSKLLIDFVIL